MSFTFAKSTRDGKHLRLELAAAGRKCARWVSLAVLHLKLNDDEAVSVSTVISFGGAGRALEVIDSLQTMVENLTIVHFTQTQTHPAPA